MYTLYTFMYTLYTFKNRVDDLLFRVQALIVGSSGVSKAVWDISVLSERAHELHITRTVVVAVSELHPFARIERSWLLFHRLGLQASSYCSCFRAGHWLVKFGVRSSLWAGHWPLAVWTTTDWRHWWLSLQLLCTPALVLGLSVWLNSVVHWNLARWWLKVCCLLLLQGSSR